MRRRRRCRLLVVSLLGFVLLAALAGAAPAFAAGAGEPWWGLSGEVVPSDLPPGGEGEIIVVLSNLGDDTFTGAGGQQAVVSVEPPAGLSATASGCTTGPPVRCTYGGTIVPYGRASFSIKVKAEESLRAGESLPLRMSVEGGGAPKLTRTQQVRIGQSTPFGVQDYEVGLYNSKGEPDTLAGSRPFELTTTLVLNQTKQQGGPRQPSALPKDLSFDLPPGVLGDPTAVAQCPMTQFSATVLTINFCPPSTVVGVATVTAFEPVVGLITKTVPVFNLEPSQGEPARFGFEVLGKIPIVIDTAVRSGSDYGVTARVNNATELGALLSSQVTIWGVPGDPRHDQSRGWECVDGGAYREDDGNKPCPTETSLAQGPFLLMPTACTSDPSSEPLSFGAELDSWAVPAEYVSPPLSVWSGGLEEPVGMLGASCATLPFEPSLQGIAEEHAGSTPTGMTVAVKLPQEATLQQNPEGTAEATVKDTTVTLPAGVQLNPSAANGLQACSEQQAGFERELDEEELADHHRDPYAPGDPEPLPFTDAPEHCPEASKVATVHVRTPLLPHELTGALYLAEPAPTGEEGKNPFDSLIALYLVAEDPVSGVLVKLAGEGELNRATGQISTSFQNTPQVPFEELKVELLGGERASLSTPALCGEYSSEASFTPWSAPFAPPVSVSGPREELAITEGCTSAGATLPFGPGFLAQGTSTQAGAFTSFHLGLERPDGQQALSGLSMHLPPGDAALLASVTPCPIAVADAAQCPEASMVGESSVSTGLGSEPFVLSGTVYLTEGFDGAPFGISVATPAERVGPFDIGTIIANSTIEVDPTTAAATIATRETRLLEPDGRATLFASALPTIIKGIPVQLKRLSVNVNRSNFMFNPTSCAPMKIEGTLNGSEGTDANASSPFQVGGCQSLPFAPTLTASTKGQASKADGTSLNVTVTSAGVGQANIQKVDLQFPKALSSRLTTLQKACTEAAFNANPASCDPDSVIGHATVHTPILKSPLTGPAYLVSHGGAAFPDVEFVLQGEGVEVVLDGKTDIKEGITYSKFESAPDAPFTTFETELPSGPDSIFTANVPEKEDFDLCKASLQMPTRIVAQDGAVIEPTTKIVAQGCGEVKSSKVKKLSLAQELKKALAQCRKQYEHSKVRRERCESRAHARYTSLALAACRKEHKQSRKQRAGCEKLARKRYGVKKPTPKTKKANHQHA